jgi:glutamyl-tRNA reductase
MAINVLGVNHKSAPINIREKLVFDKDSIPRALTEIKKIEGVNEVVLVSTCNRTEIYTENTLCLTFCFIIKKLTLDQEENYEHFVHALLLFLG